MPNGATKTESQILTRVRELHKAHVQERLELDVLRNYRRGEAGKPALPKRARTDLHELRDNCVINMCDLVVETWVESLRVNGYRLSTSADNEPAWSWWQSQRLDARQAMITRAAATYGAAYALHLPGGAVRLRSPRTMIAAYVDRTQDRWPVDALELWVEGGRRRGLYVDAHIMAEVDLGPVAAPAPRTTGRVAAAQPLLPQPTYGTLQKAPVSHGATSAGQPVTPVVGFWWRWEDDEQSASGAIEPLLAEQRALNAANFDRLVVGRYGAHPQKVLSGWVPASDEESLAMAANETWTFEDDVKATTLAAASIQPYTELVESLQVAIALQARISPIPIKTQLVNIGAEVIAAASAAEDRRRGDLQTSLGESWEQSIALGSVMAQIEGATEDDAAEVVWADVTPKSFAGIVDGVVKLAQQWGAHPEFLRLVPGVSEAMVKAIAGDISALRAEKAIEQGLGG